MVTKNAQCVSNAFCFCSVDSFREFYDRNKNAAEFKVTNPDDVDGGYFAVEYMNQWHRVEPLDERMGEAIRVRNITKRFAFLSCDYEDTEGRSIFRLKL